MPDFRKKPVVIQAVQFDGDNFEEVKKFFFDNGFREFSLAFLEKPCVYINTLEGTMKAEPKDWIIRGVKGEFYPCKPSIFAATYDAVTQPAETVTAG